MGDDVEKGSVTVHLSKKILNNKFFDEFPVLKLTLLKSHMIKKKDRN